MAEEGENRNKPPVAEALTTIQVLVKSVEEESQENTLF